MVGTLDDIQFYQQGRLVICSDEKTGMQILLVSCGCCITWFDHKLCGSCQSVTTTGCTMQQPQDTGQIPFLSLANPVVHPRGEFPGPTLDSSQSTCLTAVARYALFLFLGMTFQTW